MNNNTVKAICPDGKIRTATYRGTLGPTGRAFVRIKQDYGNVRTVTGNIERNSDEVFFFWPDQLLKNAYAIQTA